MNLNDRVLESVDRINYGLDRNYCCTLVDTVKNPRVSQEAVNILSSLATVSFSTMTLLHEVSYCYATCSLSEVWRLIRRGKMYPSGVQMC
jgi:hypothetical protein